MLRELLSAFIPIRMGMINDTPAYWRKRLFHSGYQILLKKEVNEEWLFEHHRDYNTIEEVFQEILRK